MLTFSDKDFPFLRDASFHYFDTAASAQKPRCVIERMVHVLEDTYANVHRGLYKNAYTITSLYEEARQKVRAFINAKHSKEVVFTKNATEAINLVAQSFAPQGGWQEDDEIIVSVLDHHANIVPWDFLRKKYKIRLVWFEPDDPTCLFDLKKFSSLFSSHTRLVAITHMSNVLGTILPARDIIKCAHAYDVPVLLDGTQAVVHTKVDVSDIDCDFYTFTGHKIYGPTGIGVLYAREAFLNSMPPYQGGGEMIEEVTKEKITYAGIPHRFEAGTPPIVEAIGLGRALDYISEDLGRTNIKEHCSRVHAYLFEGLKSLSGIQIFGEEKLKPIYSFSSTNGIHAHDLSMVLDQQNVAIRAGHHCAQPLMHFLGVNSICRVSCGLYSTCANVDALIRSLEYAIRFFSKKR